AAVPLSNRPPYPPPLPAVVDPRTGAWRQVFVPPGGCVEVGAAQVGAPCPRCGDKLRHPFHGRLRDAIRGRHAQPGDVPDQASGPDEIEVPADPVGVELLPPRVPAAVRRVGRE
ncbi:MAG TPA: hypothetical protein VFE78_32440, partial [Gemmataceae bacterium]|nr:hypothetical protein [Gemmataceae bacterium]